MIDTLNLRLSPQEAADMEAVARRCASMLGIGRDDIRDLRVVRRSIDSRQRRVAVNLGVRVASGEDASALPPHTKAALPKLPPQAPQVIVVGAGPAGLFASLRLIQRGIRPVILERGKDVDARRLDIAAISREGIVDPDSNYCFGEGGAGTYSDGKLYTRSKKRGDNHEVLSLLVDHGADEEILVDSHPHIGSDRLPHIIKAIRQTILDSGGVVRFSTRVERLLIEDRDGEKCCRGVVTASGEELYGPVILATGHSSRDTLRALHVQGVGMESKGFAMGVRLEHPSSVIDRIQYHSPEGRGRWLPAAEYNFVTQAQGRGVYSFCMCPGGVVVPSASGPEQSAVNGMSASARSGRWSNSGMVVEIRPGDFPEYADMASFDLLTLQEDLERIFFEAAGGSMKAPAQLMTDFIARRSSQTLPASSYAPGLVSARLDRLLPPFISERLREGFEIFGLKAKGFLTDKGVMIGLESRTSSPVRIPRNPENMEHIEIKGLYPAGEGAGYAGGIVSSAIDGIRAAESLAESGVWRAERINI